MTCSIWKMPSKSTMQCPHAHTVTSQHIDDFFISPHCTVFSPTLCSSLLCSVVYSDQRNRKHQPPEWNIAVSKYINETSSKRWTHDLLHKCPQFGSKNDTVHLSLEIYHELEVLGSASPVSLIWSWNNIEQAKTQNQNQPMKHHQKNQKPTKLDTVYS